MSDNPAAAARVIQTKLRGEELLFEPLLNKGTAFTREERTALRLTGLLPPHTHTIDEQLQRTYAAFSSKTTPIGKHIYLRALQDRNETLFYRLLGAHLAEMMPIIYTPTVGQACQEFSSIYRRPRGLFISYPERDQIDAILGNWDRNVDVIVVTDGERILGLGDQGAGGMGIPIGKLSLYTACGGIDPARTLPVFLDVGTNNPERLADPLYVGWQHERITGPDYDEFVEQFISAVERRYPDALLQFEDFAQPHAGPLLARYRDRLCTFNDDIQGTAAVTAGTLMAAMHATGGRLSDQTVAFLGAGSAGCGIARQVAAAMIHDGLSETEAHARIFMVDRNGLLTGDMDDLRDFQTPLAQDRAALSDWTVEDPARITLLETVQNAGISVLIGVSGQPGLFTEDVVKAMDANTARPIIFPLSNPTSRAEARPEDLIDWTQARAIIATGSPFEPVEFEGTHIPIAQCNNAYIFPGIGLGVLAVGATRVSDGMLMAASRALGNSSPALTSESGGLLPPLSALPALSVEIAYAVARQAQAEDLAPLLSEDETRAAIETRRWRPVYPELKPV